MSKRIITDNELRTAAKDVAAKLITLSADGIVKGFGGDIHIFPVPRGGVAAFYLVRAEYMCMALTSARECGKLRIAQTPEEADVILDDLVDSGATAARMLQLNNRANFFALIHKTADGASGYKHGEWLVFPWEASEEKSIEDSFQRLFQFIGEDPTRGGLLETPARMAKAWQHWSSGYGKDPAAILKTFEDGGEKFDEMVHVRNIPFYSQCEHHLAPFFGTVAFAYVPDGRVVGLSKLSRLVDIFARRLQVQERMTVQIIDSFVEHLSPLGAGITVRARHMCMESRGICQQGTETTTSAFRGVLKTKPEARAEFFSLTR